MGRRFLTERRRDPYYRAAQEEGLRSRAAFKLDHLARRFPIFRPGDRVLDLGAAPGGWSLVALEQIGRNGTVTAVDPRHIDPIEGVEVRHARVGDPALLQSLHGRRFDVVLSDMSPRISGAYATDHARSVELVELAFELARSVLDREGSFVAKVFEGDLLPELTARLHPFFRSVQRTKPPASREPSSELYLIALGFRTGPEARAAGAGPTTEGATELARERRAPT